MIGHPGATGDGYTFVTVTPRVRFSNGFTSVCEMTQGGILLFLDGTGLV
jgi:hypothetical protein